MSNLEVSEVTTPNRNEDEVQIGEIVSAIWRGKWVVIFISLLFSVASVFYALSIPDEYTSTSLLSPSSNPGGSSVSKLSSSLGGVAALAGVNLSSGDGGDKVTVSIALLKTWGFIEGFIEKNNIEVELFAVRGWDRAVNRLIIDELLYDEESSKWVRETMDGRRTAKPSSWELFEKMKPRLDVHQDVKTGLISISVTHYSPFVAKKWVDMLIADINDHMREKDRADAVQRIDYLKLQIEKTGNADMRAIFYHLIEEQTKALMLAEISDEYVFKTVSPAKVAERKSRPKRAFIVILGGILGTMFSIILVLVFYFKKRQAK